MAVGRRTGPQMQRLPNFQLPELKLPSVRLPRPRLPQPRLPNLRVRGLRRPQLDLDDPQRLAQSLQFFFYLLMFVALLAIFSGATGTGVLMLIAGAALHVVRSSLVELAAQRQARRERGERKRQVRLRSHRARRAQGAGAARPAANPPAPSADRPARPAAKTAAAAEEIRVSATPPLRSRRRPAVAQPGPSPARKQRVI